jgi:hypothetical protein
VEHVRRLDAEQCGGGDAMRKVWKLIGPKALKATKADADKGRHKEKRDAKTSAQALEYIRVNIPHIWTRKSEKRLEKLRKEIENELEERHGRAVHNDRGDRKAGRALRREDA